MASSFFNSNNCFFNSNNCLQKTGGFAASNLLCTGTLVGTAVASQSEKKKEYHVHIVSCNILFIGGVQDDGT
jgi:hypothetical protein